MSPYRLFLQLLIAPWGLVVIMWPKHCLCSKIFGLWCLMWMSCFICLQPSTDCWWMLRVLVWCSPTADVWFQCSFADLLRLLHLFIQVQMWRICDIKQKRRAVVTVCVIKWRLPPQTVTRKLFIVSLYTEWLTFFHILRDMTDWKPKLQNRCSRIFFFPRRSLKTRRIWKSTSPSVLHNFPYRATYRTTLNWKLLYQRYMSLGSSRVLPKVFQTPLKVTSWLSCWQKRCSGFN